MKINTEEKENNEDKYHLIVNTDKSIEIRIVESLIERSKKFLGIKINNKLNFNAHVKGLCKKANNKLRALAGATPYVSLEKNKRLMSFFFNAQFNYCPFILVEAIITR